MIVPNVAEKSHTMRKKYPLDGQVKTSTYTRFNSNLDILKVHLYGIGCGWGGEGCKPDCRGLKGNGNYGYRERYGKVVIKRDTYTLDCMGRRKYALCFYYSTCGSEKGKKSSLSVDLSI